MIDSHAHLNDSQFSDDLAAVLARAKESGIAKVINVGFDLPSSIRAVELSRDFPECFAVVGIHPHDAKECTLDALDCIDTLLDEKKVVAVGETGLDYYYDYSPRSEQQKVFAQHLKLANRRSLPVVVHSREATSDTLAILKEYAKTPCVLHCFSGSAEIAKEYLEMGFYFSFGGPITFANARKLRSVVETIPLDRIMLETDCPYLAPVPFRGKRNEPSLMRFAAEKLGEIHKKSLEEINQITVRNTVEFFRLVEEGQ